MIAELANSAIMSPSAVDLPAWLIGETECRCRRPVRLERLGDGIEERQQARSGRVIGLPTEDAMTGTLRTEGARAATACAIA